MSNIFEQRIKANLARVPVWERKTLADRWDDFVKRYRENEYIVTKEEKYSYGQTDQQINLLAKGLIKLGLKTKEHIGIIMANYPVAVFLQFAVAKIGCVSIPFNYRMLAEEIKYVLSQSDTNCLITMDVFGNINYIEVLSKIIPEVFQGRQAKSLPALRNIVVFSPQGKKYPETIDYNELLAMGNAVTDAELIKVTQAVKDPDAIVNILYTSGTTGKPKGVMISHDMLWRKAYCSLLGRAIEEGRRILLSLPVYHIFALVEGVLAVTFVGGAIIMQVSWSPKEALEFIDEYRANDILCVPTMGLDLLNQLEGGNYDLTSLRAMYCAGAPAPVTLWERLIKELGLEYLNTGYGMTETTSAPVQSPYDATVEQIASRVGVVIPGGAAGLSEFGGKCFEYKTVDPISGKDLPPGAEGELACRGNTVTIGYYNKPEETAEVLGKDGWLRSGDIGIIHDDGYLELTGRSKEIYRVGGENVAPKEIEEEISKHPKVSQAYIVGVPDERLGEVGMAFVVLKKNEQCSEKEIIQYCSGRVARFKVPKYVRFVRSEELPKTTTGKIQKFKLQEMGKS
ncbi:MAG: AMP-binding protein [Thermodesulfobacteriota bacterium]